MLDTRDLGYFICLSALFILFTLYVIKVQRQKRGGQKKMFAALAVIIVLGIISSLTFIRFDFTKEKRFTISKISRGILDSLPKDVKVTVYLNGDNLPGGMKRLRSAVKDMLHDLQLIQQTPHAV